MKIPTQGTSREAIVKTMQAYRDADADAGRARLFSLVYSTRPDVLEVAKEAFTTFFSENALNPMAFPSLRRMETDVIAMTLDLMHAPEEAAGSMTSGGSESLLLAVKTARDWARVAKPNIKKPSMLLPLTAHPALSKAAHLLDIEIITVPMTAALQADVEAAKKLITDDTILVVGSAPQYPHGVIDPITELAALAKERGILCHVDACFGGFMLPWIEKLGLPVTPFDFRVPGVTSISADLHKYGYAAKGASTVMYRSRTLRKHQFYAHADWPGGLFASPGILGTRPGGAIAAAWAVMNYLGEEGYLDLAKRAMNATNAIKKGIGEIKGLKVLGNPAMSAIAIGTYANGSPEVDIYVIAELMNQRGWHFDRNQAPASIHLTISPAHDEIAGEFIKDLRECMDYARNSSNEQPQGKAAMYGMLGALPDRVFVRDALVDLIDSLDSGSTELLGGSK